VEEMEEGHSMIAIWNVNSGGNGRRSQHDSHLECEQWRKWKKIMEKKTVTYTKERNMLCRNC
jgi:hypothetical protein